MKNLLLPFGERDNSRGQLQVATGLIWGIVGFMVAVIAGILIVTTLSGANFFTAGSAGANSVGNISTNLTSGVNTIVGYFPTLFTVVAIVVILGMVGLLIIVVRRFGMGGGSFSQ